MRILLCILLCWASSSTLLLGQSAETGLPFISNFTPMQYNANTQNWAVLQDQRGVMYFGNNRGVLEYDGVKWNLIPVKNHSIARSLAIDAAGTIFVGAVGEFGYLQPDQTGKLQYFSLLDLVPEADRKFADVWSTLVRGDEVYFHTLYRLFRYKQGKITSWPLYNSYHRSFLVQNTIYVRQEGLGLMLLQDDSLRLISGGDQFAQVSVSAMLPLGENILIGSRNQGMHLYNPRTGTITKLQWQANAFLEENLLYHGTVLANGNFAFSTIKDGFIVTDTAGNVLLHLNQNNGLLYKSVYYLFSDKVGALWLGLASGLSKVEVISPISLFDKVLGLHGGILAITRFKGTLFASTHQGVFYLNKEAKFEQVKGLSAQSWQLEVFNVPGEPGQQKLITATTDGIFEITKEGAALIHAGRAGALISSRADPSRVYLGLNGTIASLRYDQGKWREEGTFRVVFDEIRSMREDENGYLWMGSMYAGVFCLDTKAWEEFLLTKNPSALNSIKNYGTPAGLPTINWNYFHHINNKLLVTTQKGIFRYNKEKDAFERADELMKAFKDADRWFYYLHEDQQGNIWFDSDKGKGMLIKSAKGYSLSENQFKRIIVSPENQVTGYTDDAGVLWFGTPDGLFRFDAKFKKNYRQPFATLIRKIVIGEDSVIFNGTQSALASSSTPTANLGMPILKATALEEALPFDKNSLTFHYATPVYEQEGSSAFSYFLEGYDNNWSAWTHESRKEYTNLPEGDYVFKVRAKNFYDTVSEEALYEFKIAPPWYRTPLAYVGYLLMLTGMVTVVSKVNSKRLRADNMRLEAIVESRTTEIKQQKAKIEGQKNEVEKSYKNVTTLSEIGQNITATLDLKSIIHTLYTSLDALMDVASFGVGIYNEQTQSIDFQYAKEQGQELPPFSHALSANNKLAVWCFNNKKKVFINDLQQEYSRYIPALSAPAGPGGKHASSILYFPIRIKKKTIGVITVQSYKTHAYQAYHVDILRTLAAYTAIALDNSHAYFRLNEINEELNSTLNNLKHTQMQLVQSEKMASLGQLTAGVAHEINNPINFVSAGIDSLSTSWEELNELLLKYNALKPNEDNSQLLLEIEQLKKQLDLPYLLKEIPELLTGVKSGAQRTTEIVKSLRNFARLDEDSLKTANLHEGLESTLIIVRNKIADRITVERHYDPQLPEVLCYPGQLNQVFMNIISNAVEAIEGTGTLTLTTHKQDEYIIITIRDSGKGMTPEVRQRIFEPFFTTKGVGEGTGLGLSISYSIIEKHQGKLSVASAPGEGSTFTIQLPLIARRHGR